MDNIKNYLNYSRDDVFIISVNNSADLIEKVEAEVYINNISIYKYYALISALFSKTHPYTKKKGDIKLKLKEVRNKLYNNNMISELKHNNPSKDSKIRFLNILDNLTNIYQEMTESYCNIGIFPKKNKDDLDKPSAVKNIS